MFQYSANLFLDCNVGLGLSLRNVNEHAVVSAVKPSGLIATWNNMASKAYVVRQGDRIDAVKTERQGTEECKKQAELCADIDCRRGRRTQREDARCESFVQVLKRLDEANNKTITITFRRPAEFAMTVQGSLGIRVKEHVPSQTLEVLALRGEGCVPSWNKQNPDQLVNCGDSIVRVHVIGQPQPSPDNVITDFFDFAAKKTEFELTFLRYSLPRKGTRSQGCS